MCRPAGKRRLVRRSKMVWAAADPDRTRIYADVILDKQRFVPDVHLGRSLLYVLLNSLSLTSFLLPVASYGFPCIVALSHLPKCLPSVDASETTIFLLTEPGMYSEHFVRGGPHICRCGVFIPTICNYVTLRPLISGSGDACIRVGGGE